MRFGVFADRDADGGRHRLENRLQRCGEGGRRCGGFDLADAIDGKAVPVGGSGLVTGVEKAYDSVEPGKGCEVAETNIGEGARRARLWFAGGRR